MSTIPVLNQEGYDYLCRVLTADQLKEFHRETGGDTGVKRQQDLSLRELAGIPRTVVFWLIEKSKVETVRDLAGALDVHRGGENYADDSMRIFLSKRVPGMSPKSATILLTLLAQHGWNEETLEDLTRMIHRERNPT